MGHIYYIFDMNGRSIHIIYIYICHDMSYVTRYTVHIFDIYLKNMATTLQK